MWLHRVTGCYRVLHGVAGCCKVLHGVKGLHVGTWCKTVLQGVTLVTWC